MNISRRHFIALGGGAAASCSLAYPGLFPSAPIKLAAEAERESGKVKIKDVHSASIADEYTCNLIKITTNSDLFGIGEARPKISVAKYVEKYKPIITGADPLRVDYLTRKMIAANDRPQRDDIGVIAGIETALWDLAGKILNTPVYNLLGGQIHERIKVYYDLSPAETPETTEPEPWVECARQAKDAGFKAMKFDIYRGGGGIQEWAQILEAIRDEVGNAIELGVDLHWKLNIDQTEKLIQKVEPLNLWFIEDPMKYEGNLNHYQRLSAECKIPIVAGEQMITRMFDATNSFRPLIEQQACNIIEPDSQYCGGLLELKRVADWAEVYGMDTLCHNMCSPVGTFAQAHACATIHSFVAMENACADQVIENDGDLYEDGYLKLNNKPGYGIDLDEDYCRAHLTKDSKFFHN